MGKGEEERWNERWMEQRRNKCKEGWNEEKER